MQVQNTTVLYEEVANLTSQMLQAAKQHDWDTLIALEDSCAPYVEKLQTVEDAESTLGEQYERKVACIKRILADDREIRSLVSPWMESLNAMMNNYKTAQKVTQAYSH